MFFYCLVSLIEQEMYKIDDTIAAISTPIGPGGIGIVRMSGPLSGSILKRIFRPKKDNIDWKSHRLYYGHVIDPANQKIVDEVLATIMYAPHTYTREEVAEIHSHSGYLILRKLLELVIKLGARLAEPGEFTRRAFLNGRLDLTQAEAVIDLINSKSERALELAINQLSGKYRNYIENIRENLIDIKAHIEVAIDFPEEEVEIFPPHEMADTLERKVIVPLQEFLSMYNEGKLHREGISVVFMGRPNVGKSSLLNRLLDEERAIVTPIPGTTRDIIEENLQIRGLPIKLLDTAGIGKPKDEVERIGIERALKKAESADICLFVIDVTEGFTKEEERLVADINLKKSIIILNKIDLLYEKDNKWDINLPDFLTALPVIKTSALTGEGIGYLKDEIFNMATKDLCNDIVSDIVPNTRHKLIIEDILSILSALKGHLEEGIFLDLAAVEIEDALNKMGDIIGITTPEDVLNRIFQQFCIGK